MYMSRFGVKRYKCLGDIDIPLTPIHVLIGENDAGKTSLLEAMEAFTVSSREPFASCFPGPWANQELVLHGAEEWSVELWGEWRDGKGQEGNASPAGCQYGFEVFFTGPGSECLCGGEWFRGADEEKHDIRDPKADRTQISRFGATGKSPPGDAAAIKGLLSAMGSAQTYSLNAKLMATPAAFAPERAFRLAPDGFGLATLLDDILGRDLAAFVDITRRFCAYYSQFSNVFLQTEMAVERHDGANGLATSARANGKAIYLTTTSGQTIRAQQASDGAILFLGLLALAHVPNPPNLLLLEEPENGIYPKRLGEVIRLLKQMVSREDGPRFPQIILTTHSPYVLSFFEPEEVTLLSRPPGEPDGPVRARPLRDAPNIRERLGGGEFYLGELWYNLSEEELFGER